MRHIALGKPEVNKCTEIKVEECTGTGKLDEDTSHIPYKANLSSSLFRNTRAGHFAAGSM
jgi:hypothetical protein